MRRCLLGLLVVALAGGCSSSADPPESTSAEPRHEDLQGPGTPLGDGLSVVPGTRLLGTVWPSLSGTVGGRGATTIWSAVLELTGDPVEVHNAYVDQVRDAGFFIVRGRHSCGVDYQGSDRSFFAPPRGVEPEGVAASKVGCSLEGAIVEDRSTVAIARVVVTRTAHDHPFGVYVSHVEVSVERWASGALHGSPQSRPFDPEPPLAGRQVALAEPPPPPPIPGAGDPIEPDGVEGEPLDVVDGSEVLAPVATEWCGTSGYDALLAIDDGDAEGIIDAYRRQVDSWDYEQRAPERMRFRGRDAVIMSYGASGAGTLHLVVVEGRRFEPTYLRLTRCRD